MGLTITPLSDTVGAQIVGVDLSQSALAEDVAAIRQALVDHLVIVVRDNLLTRNNCSQRCGFSVIRWSNI